MFGCSKGTKKINEFEDENYTNSFNRFRREKIKGIMETIQILISLKSADIEEIVAASTKAEVTKS